ncbi:MAG: transcriptional regulator [Cyanobacteria bacterium RYN_339]|nr:transcriptional regulator [Cyanobacteria bacterium RYN_339]
MSAFFGCQRQIMATLMRDLDSQNLARDEFDVLVVLGKAGAKPCNELARETMRPNPTLTRTLARMEERGLLRSEKGATDARQKFVSLTPQGQATYERAFFPHLLLVDRCIDHLTPLEQADLGRLLHKLAAGFTGAERDGVPHD